ncbi:MAG: hypothetical protein J0L57_05445 [Burkholderiales bacterium]|nr:hypothetical protein [Burkholderiales bacterium]
MATSEKQKSKKSGKDAKPKAGDRKREAAASQEPAPAPADAGRYADGAAFDEITYLEAKLILKPDRFTSVDSFRQFGALVQRTAARTGVGFIPDPAASQRPEVREILFFDTPDFRLYNNAFILRRRVTYVDGFPVGDPEIVFKYRHPDEKAATAVDVRPKIAGKHRIKFKAEALPLKDQVGGYRLLYSHNCQFGLSQMHDADKLSMDTLLKALPALKALKTTGGERLSLVNGGIVEEVLLPLGQLDFGKGQVGKCDISLWRTRGEHLPLVGEFAFQVKFPSRASVAAKPKKLAAQFYIALQQDVKDWLALGVTKTAMVYRLKGNAPQSHE